MKKIQKRNFKKGQKYEIVWILGIIFSVIFLSMGILKLRGLDKTTLRSDYGICWITIAAGITFLIWSIVCLVKEIKNKGKF